MSEVNIIAIKLLYELDLSKLTHLFFLWLQPMYQEINNSSNYICE